MTGLKVEYSWSAAVFHLQSLYIWTTPLPKEFIWISSFCLFVTVYEVLHEAN